MAIACALGLGLSAPTLRAQSAPAASANGGEATRTIHMRLFAPTGDTLLYDGLRTVASSNGRVTVTTTYRRPGGEMVQRTEAVYDADTLAPVSYTLDDVRVGEQETLRREGGQVSMGYRASAQEKVSTGTVPMAPDLRFVATVEPMLVREWARLVAGEEVPFRLLVASRQDVFRFRIVRDKDAAIRHPEAIVVRMEPGTWLVRQLVSPMFFVLEEAPPHRLLEFRGRSSLKTDDGADQDVRIEYSESPGR